MPEIVDLVSEIEYGEDYGQEIGDGDLVPNGLQKPKKDKKKTKQPVQKPPQPLPLELPLQEHVFDK